MKRSVVRDCMVLRVRMLPEGKRERERWAMNGQLYDTLSSSVLWLSTVHQIELLTHRKPQSSLCVFACVCVHKYMTPANVCVCAHTHKHTHAQMHMFCIDSFRPL